MNHRIESLALCSLIAMSVAVEAGDTLQIRGKAPATLEAPRKEPSATTKRFRADLDTVTRTLSERGSSGYLAQVCDHAVPALGRITTAVIEVKTRTVKEIARLEWEARCLRGQAETETESRKSKDLQLAGKKEQRAAQLRKQLEDLVKFAARVSSLMAGWIPNSIRAALARDGRAEEPVSAISLDGIEEAGNAFGQLHEEDPAPVE